MTTQKKFRLSPTQIKPLALGLGGCLATDRIMVDGRPVGYMYRNHPINPQDSGWRFFTGNEDKACMGNNENHDVNTIAKYCNYAEPKAEFGQKQTLPIEHIHR
jgi:hypothetical protein